MIKLYKNGDNMGILTDEVTEGNFISKISDLFQDMISKREFLLLDKDVNEKVVNILEEEIVNDWSFQFNIWLPQIVDICCKYRGFNSDSTVSEVIKVGRCSDLISETK